MSHENGNACKPRDERAPNVGPELVAVHDLGALSSKEPYERPPGTKVELRAAIELEDANAGRPELIEQHRARRTRDTKRSIEALRIKPLDHLRSNSLAAAASRKMVDDGDDSDPRGLRRGR